MGHLLWAAALATGASSSTVAKPGHAVGGEAGGAPLRLDANGTVPMDVPERIKTHYVTSAVAVFRRRPRAKC